MVELSTLPIALRDATAALSTVSQTPRLDAEFLAAFALQIPRLDMLMHAKDLTVPSGFADMIQRRLAHEPVAYITGSQAFWDIQLCVSPDVLIPRADSETLIEAAQAAFNGTAPPRRILDLGTGSGALLLAALSLFPDATGIGVDASAAALGVARYNAEQLGFANRVQMQQRNWHEAGWANGLVSQFDLILCNPPYVETGAALMPMVAMYEPHAALFAGAEGLDDYQILLPQISELLAPAGIAIFEIGHLQAKSVGDLAYGAGLKSSLQYDLAGNPRCLTMRI